MAAAESSGSSRYGLLLPGGVSGVKQAASVRSSSAPAADVGKHAAAAAAALQSLSTNSPRDAASRESQASRC